MSPVKRICVFEHSVMTNFNGACPAIQRGQGSGFLSEGSSWLTACMSEQRRFWRDCAGSPKPSLLAQAISTKFAWRGPNVHKQTRYWVESDLGLKFIEVTLTSPTNISNISTPNPHQSTDLVYDGSVNTSGARNSGVPQNVLVLSPKPMPSLHRPKSAIFRYPSESNSRLSNFKSLKYMRVVPVNRALYNSR